MVDNIQENINNLTNENTNLKNEINLKNTQIENLN